MIPTLLILATVVWVGVVISRRLSRAFANGRTPAVAHFAYLLVVKDVQFAVHAVRARKFRKELGDL